MFILKVIKLSVVRLLLEDSSDCSKDRVEIYDGWTIDEGVCIARLCGAGLPVEPYLTDTNMAVVSFMSDETRVDAGFRIDYKPQALGTHLSDSSTDNTQSEFYRLYLYFCQTSLAVY